MSILLVSIYDLGRQPFGLASPAAWLREAGFEVATCDMTREMLDVGVVRRARLIALFVPMHTATRLASSVIARLRAINRSAPLCAFGLYAPLNAAHLKACGVEVVLGAEFEADLVDVARAVEAGTLERLVSSTPRPGGPPPRLQFHVPDRSSLPPLGRYATLQMGDDRRIVGYTEASRGCKHRCGHCPIVPVYDGHFRVVPVDVVLADVAQQIASGAQHITFGDPDFFNGIGHAKRVISALRTSHPDVTFDVTVKIEHLLEHRDVLPEMRDAGCVLVTSAVESFDDHVLEILGKGHTRADVVEAVTLCREVGLALAPTFVAFMPWTTPESYRRFLATIAELDLIEAVAPIQLALRLLLPEGSLLLARQDVRARVSGFDARGLVHTWHHADPSVDELAREVGALIGRRLSAERREVFEAVWQLAHEDVSASERIPPTPPRPSRAAIPFLNEPWYC